MASHVWTVLCRKASIDRESNVVSLLEVIESIQITAPTASNPPLAVPIQLEIVTLWARSDPGRPERASARFSLHFPDGTQVEGSRSEVNLMDWQRLRTVIQMQGFPVKGPGIHHIVIQSRQDDGSAWTEVAKIPIEIAIIAATAVTPAAAPSTH